MKLSIIIPAYNEEHTIETVIDAVKSVKHQDNLEKEIIIVNDGSTDRTAQILDKYTSDPVIKIFHQKNMGKTAALSEGIKDATGDIILIQDADLEYMPDHYPKLVEPILKGETAVVYGSRFKGTIKDMTFINRFANVLSNIVFNLLFKTNITDINTCYKIFKKDIIKNITIESKDFTFETEVTAKLINQGQKIIEIPIDYVARSKEEGKKINWLKAWKMFWGIIKYK